MGNREESGPKETIEGIGNALELMKKIKEKGGTFDVCPPVRNMRVPAGGAKHDWIEKAGGD